MTELDASTREQLRAPYGVGPNTRNYTLVGVLFGAAFPVVATAFLLIQQQLPWTLGGIMTIQGGNPLMWMVDTAPLFLGALAAMAGLRQDALAERNAELAVRGQELSVLKASLEDRVVDRTRELESRNIQTRAAIQITRQIAEIRDTTTLLSTAASLVAQNFPDAEADVYLLDDRGDTAILEASSSKAGVERIQQGGSINVGDETLVGQAAAQGKSISRAHEMALALIARGRILGAMHVRYPESRPFAETDAEVLQLLADQLAATLENARLLEQARASVDQLEQLSGERTQAIWQEYLRQRNVAYQYSPQGIRPASEGLKAEGPQTISVPLMIRGQQIGALTLKRGAGGRWAEGERDLAAKVATQVALALENTRLLEETRDRAMNEQRISAISDRLGQSVDMDTLLQTAARELASLPEVSDVTVFLGPAVGPADQAR
ncbi:MAG: GAF domain-containing protein [Rudaea sp.]